MKRYAFWALTITTAVTPGFGLQPSNGTPSPRSSLKSESELEKWFYCYRYSKKTYQNYEAEFQNYLRAASETFGIHPTNFSCLIFRESSHWRGIRSPAGAIGFAQFMPETIIEVDRWLKRNDRQALTLWKQYLSRVQSPQVTTAAFGQKEAVAPVYAIGAAALYLRGLELQIQNYLKTKGIKIDPQTQRMLAMAAYNRGTYRVLKRLTNGRSLASTTLQREETIHHVKFISMCLETGNFSPPPGTLEARCEGFDNRRKPNGIMDLVRRNSMLLKRLLVRTDTSRATIKN